MKFSGREVTVSSGKQLTFVMDGVEGRNANITFQIGVRFVNRDKVAGVYLDLQWTKLPDSIKPVNGVDRFPQIKTQVWANEFAVEFEGVWYPLFEVKEVDKHGNFGVLYFHVFTPFELSEQMSGSNHIVETPVMYQESLPVGD